MTLIASRKTAGSEKVKTASPENTWYRRFTKVTLSRISPFHRVSIRHRYSPNREAVLIIIHFFRMSSAKRFSWLLKTSLLEMQFFKINICTNLRSASYNSQVFQNFTIKFCLFHFSDWVQFPYTRPVRVLSRRIAAILQTQQSEQFNTSVEYV